MSVESWLRQPSTIHGLGVLAAAAGAALAHVTTGNPTVDAAVAAGAYVLVHLGVNDNSATAQALDKLATDIATAAMQKKLAAAMPELFGDGVAVASALATQPAPTTQGS